MKTVKVSKDPIKTKIYQELYERTAKLPLDLTYIANSDSHLIYDENDILVCAYTLNDGRDTPFRYFSIFNETELQYVLNYPKPIAQDSFIEIAAIVMTPESSSVVHYRCYLKLMWHAFKYAIEHKKKRILGGSVIPKIQQMQYELMSHLLYKGNINQSLSIINNAQGLVMLYYASRTEFIMKAGYLLCKKFIKYMTKTRKDQKQPTLQPA